MYFITAFDNVGKKLLDQPLEAKTDEDAKEKGEALLKEKEMINFPFRIIHTSGRLVEFKSHKGKSGKKEA